MPHYSHTMLCVHFWIKIYLNCEWFDSRINFWTEWWPQESEFDQIMTHPRAESLQSSVCLHLSLQADTFCWGNRVLRSDTQLFSLYKVEVAQRPFTAPECLFINNQDSSWHQRVCCFHFFPLCFTQKEVGKKARLWSYYCHHSCSSVSYINTRVQQGLLLLWLILYN